MQKKMTHDEHAASAALAATTFENTRGGSIKFICACGKHLIEPLSLVNCKGYCPKCKRGIAVPGVNNPNVLAIRCECGLDSPITLIRKGLTTCPRCGRKFHLPKTPRYIPQDIILAAVIYGGLSFLAIMTFILLFALL